MARNTRFWGQAAQREYTARRLCPGTTDVPPHLSRWWRWLDPDAHGDSDWHCCACDWRAPRVSPIDGSTVAEPARKLAA